MKKSIIIGIIALFALVIGGILFTSGLKNQKGLLKTSYNVDDFSNIKIDIDKANVTFVKRDGQNEVVCEEFIENYHTINVEDDTLYIKGRDPRKWYEHISFNFNIMKITIYLSNDSYNNLDLYCSTGNVDIPNDFKFNAMKVNLSTGNCNCKADILNNCVIKASTGNITLESNCKNVEINTTTGIINLSNCNILENIICNSTTGGIYLNNVKGDELILEATTGKIKLTNSIISGNSSIETSTGNVIFDRFDSNTMNVETDTGSVKGTLLSSKIFITDSDTGKINVPESVSGGRCKIKTDTGYITITIV